MSPTIDMCMPDLESCWLDIRQTTVLTTPTTVWVSVTTGKQLLREQSRPLFAGFARGLAGLPAAEADEKLKWRSPL